MSRYVLSKWALSPNPPLGFEQAFAVVFWSHFVRLCRFLVNPSASPAEEIYNTLEIRLIFTQLSCGFCGL